MTDPRLARMDGARFRTASQIGYGTTETHALLAALRAALAAGLPIDGLLAARRLPEVSLGYDMAEVDDFLASLADAPGTEPAGPQPPTFEVPAADPVAPSADPVEPSAESRDRLLQEIRTIRFRMARRGTAGYDVGDVDIAVDRAETAVAAGQSLDFLRTQRFRMARRGSTGYDCADVDQFIDSLLGPSAAADSPTANRAEPAEEASFGMKFARWLGLAGPR